MASLPAEIFREVERVFSLWGSEEVPQEVNV
jgi:hypothetical protein